MSLNLKQRNGYWYVTGTILRLDGETVRVRQSTGVDMSRSKRLATAKMHEIQRDVVVQTGLPEKKKEKVKINTVAEMNARYVKRPEGFLSDMKYSIFNRFDAKFGKLDVKDVMLEDVYKFFHNPKHKPNTVRRHMTDVIASINYSKERGFPCIIFHDQTGREIELKKPPEGEGKTRWLTEVERDRLIDCCDEAIRHAVMFLFYTGARLSDMFDVTDKEVMHGEVTLYTRKGRSRRTVLRQVPIAHAIKDALEVRCMKGGRLFPNPLGSRWRKSGVSNDGRKIDNTNFYHFFHEACHKAGIKEFTPHDCRHTFASLLMQKGANLIEIQKLLGHSSLTMVQRYAHLAPNALLGVIERFGCGSDTNVAHKDVGEGDVVLTEGIEPSTSYLPSKYSTTELRQPKPSIKQIGTQVKKRSGVLTKDVGRRQGDTHDS